MQGVKRAVTQIIGQDGPALFGFGGPRVSDNGQQFNCAAVIFGRPRLEPLPRDAVMAVRPCGSECVDALRSHTFYPSDKRVVCCDGGAKKEPPREHASPPTALSPRRQGGGFMRGAE
jgi:hypothetical protein